ncbi:hypothetical protein BOH72_26330 [Mycobacterium sp. WY10]|nr:hypothetical protein BOH72_26330 [Mycobacterium sp. WY10]
MALRLMIAHLEEDTLDRELHCELLLSQSGMSAGQFYMCDKIAWMNARAMKKYCDTGELRDELFTLLESVIA